MTPPAVALLFLGALLAPADSATALGDSLLRSGRYQAAALEYRRALFVLSGDTTDAPAHRADSVRLRLGLALGGIGNLRGASEALTAAADADPTLVPAARMTLAGFYAGEQRYSDAALELTDAMLFAADSVERRSLRACLAWLSLAEQDFTLASAEYAEAGRADAAAALRKLAPVRYRNATAAALMSSLVPGSGEIYAGRPATGLLSLAVTGGSALGTWLLAKSGDWVGASVVLSTFFLRFYNGSRTNAARFTEEFNQELLKRRLRELSGAGITEPDWFSSVRELVGPDFPARTPR